MLRGLDDALVPRAAAGLRASLDACAQARNGAVATARSVRVGALARLQGADGPLRRLDRRFATRGPLRRAADAPPLSIGLVSVLLVVATGVAIARSGPPPEPPPVTALVPSVLGPRVGTTATAYVAATRAGTAEASRSAPDSTRVALVSFRRGLTPAQALSLAGPLEVLRAYLHPPLSNAEVVPVDTESFLADLATVYDEIARRKAQDARELAALGRSIRGDTKQEKQFRGFYLAAATTSQAEARAYRSDCACVIGLLVRAKARHLAELEALGEVRAVEVGPRGEASALQAQPLLPETTGVVRRPTRSVAREG